MAIIAKSAALPTHASAMPVTLAATVSDVESWFARGILLATAIGALLLGQPEGINLIDAWWNFGLGHLMLEQRQLITIDPFSFTPTAADAINQQWLAQLVWAAVYDAGGRAGVLAVSTAIIVLTGLVLWSIGRMLGASRRSLVIASLLASLQLLGYFQVRAQTLAFALAAVLLWSLQRGGRTAWLAVPLAAVWANVHGSFPLASCFAAAFAIGNLSSPSTRRRAIQYMAIAAATAIATLLNPYGIDVWRYAVQMSTNEGLRTSLTEWAPTSVRHVAGTILFLQLAAGGFLLGWRRPRIPVTWLLLTGSLAIFGLTAVRNVPWFGIVSLPVWALILNGSFAGFKDRVTRPRTLRLMVCAVLVVMAIVTGRYSQNQLPLISSARMSQEELTLSDLSTYLQQYPDGLLFQDADWGAYLEAHLSPVQQVFIDNRYEIHPKQVWDDYYAVEMARFDWQNILDKYKIERIAVDPERSPDLVNALDASGTWSEVWRTDHGNQHAVVWVRTA
jgi:hypothetical protein